MVTTLPEPASPGTTRSFYSHILELNKAPERIFTEALFTTFNVDLKFFETRVLGPVRSTGAVVTVICDGSVYAPDPRSMVSAGRRYHVGVVDMRAAFHPKVSVLVGPERALIGIGSGNLTTGGWLANDEILTVIDVRRDEPVPRPAVEITGWLERLLTSGDTLLRLGTASADAIARTAAALHRLLDGAEQVDTGMRVVTTLNGPIISQLPEHRVDHLFLQAAFHDPRGSALDSLISRYSPTQVHVGVQRGRTVIMPAELVRVASAHGVELTWQDSGAPLQENLLGQYQHAKLIECVTGDQRWSLTGSPNITGAALLTSMADGGNCEVGVVSTSHPSLFRGSGAPLTVGDVPEVRFGSPATATGAEGLPVPVLLGATLVDGSIRVELAHPVSFDVELVGSHFGDDPESVFLVGTIPAGHRDAVVDAAVVEPGSRLQLKYVVGGVARVSAHHPLLYPHTALQGEKAARQRTGNASATIGAVLGEWWVLDAYLKIAEEIRAQQAEPATTAPSRGGNSNSSQRQHTHPSTPAPELSLDEYLERAVARLGTVLIDDPSAGLILPDRLIRTTIPTWLDILTEPDDATTDETLTDEEADKELAETERLHAETTSPFTQQHPPQEQKRWRKSFERTADAVGGRPEIDRATFVALLLVGTHMNIWDGATDDRQLLLARALSTLPGDDIREDLKPTIAAVAAVGLHRLSWDAAPDHRIGTGRAYAQTVERLRPLLGAVDEDGVRSVIRRIYHGSPTEPDADAVLDLVRGELDANPWPEIVSRIQWQWPDWEVTLEGQGHISIRARSRAEDRIATEAMELVPQDLTVAVKVRVKEETFTFVRHDDTFVARETLRGRKIWKSYALTTTRSPLSIANSNETASQARLDDPPFKKLSDRGQRALEAARIPPDEA